MARSARSSQRTSKQRTSKQGVQVKLRPADAFDLIRWLARSQSDPRKAVAEFVQNSLDAGARQIEVERCRVRKQLALIVRDDGEGVLPELGREEALRYIAGHIGHSRKMNLTPLERRERVVAGKYGVGLLGFWSVGKAFELRSRVGGSEQLALRLEEDRQGGEIVRVPGRLDARATFTEVVISGVHDGALRVLGGGRLASYLSSELRGQLLQRDVTLSIHDRLARGGAPQRFIVRPQRYLGEALLLPQELAVPEQAPMRVELYVATGSEPPVIQLACAGTVVADDFRELSMLGLAEAPWVGQGLTGVIDFPDFNVPPGTRRGVVPDAVAQRFRQVLMDLLAPLVRAELERLQRERERAAKKDVAKDLQKAFKGLGRRLPQYELPGVKAPAGEATPGGSRGHAATGHALEGSASDGQNQDETAEFEPPDEAPEPELFPPGPAVAFAIVPDPIEVPLGATRRVRVRATDQDGRPVVEGLQITWSLHAGSGIALEAAGLTARLSAPPEAELGARAELCAALTEPLPPGATDALQARATVIVTDVPEAQGAFQGIPEPEFVQAPSGSWRSRLVDFRWQVNEAHEDFIALRSDAKARLRYLLTLFAKEVVQRSFASPGSDELLERLVEVLAHAERNLRGA